MSPTVITKIVLAMFLWAACFPLITAGLQYSPHLTFATMRAVLAGATLVGLAMILRRPFPRGWRTWLTLGIVGIGATSLGFLGMFHAAEFVSPGLATVIANAQPLLAAILGVVWLGERLPKVGWVGLSIGFVGILVIALPRLLGGGQEGSGHRLRLYRTGHSWGDRQQRGDQVHRWQGGWDFHPMGLQLLIGSVPRAIGSLALEDQNDHSVEPRLHGMSLSGTGPVRLCARVLGLVFGAGGS